MGDNESWPPKSAYAALISSPEGRKRVADFQAGLGPSPIKRAPGTPSLLDRLRLARNGNEGPANAKEGIAEVDEGEDEDEDEETLQLKLAAIEARLKLKKLQKVKKDEEPPSSVRSRSALSEAANTRNNSSVVEVPLSPSKRCMITAESRSPNRVLLGIDKGRKAADVSLRRAQTVTGSPLKQRRYNEGIAGRSNPSKSRISTNQSSSTEAITAIKSFSERMAQTREEDNEQAQKRKLVHQMRQKQMDLDQAELERYKALYEAKSKTLAESLAKMQSTRRNDTNFTRQEVVNGGRVKSSTKQDSVEQQSGDASLFEGYSGLHLNSRVLSHAFLKRTFPEDRFTVYKVPDLLRDVTSPAYELPDQVCDFVVFGIVASKSQPLDQKRRADDKTKSSDQSNMKWDDGLQNQKKFMALTITDLHWTVDLYLFDTAVPRYHRLSVGTVVAIVNPSIMRPRKGREDTGAFSMSLHNSEDTVLEIGRARDLGFCKSLRKDESACGSWVNAAKTEICEFHLNMQIARTQASRMGVNTGANGFGHQPNNRKNVSDPRLRSDTPGSGKGLLPAAKGRSYDRETGTHYYVAAASSNNRGGQTGGTPRFRSGMSAAAMLDNDIDDPFIAEGQLIRDREARLQKRMASQEKERQIAKQLGKLRNVTDAGADYMRKRITTNETDQKQHATTTANGTRRSGYTDEVASVAKPDLRAQIGRKRAAQDVQLSPVKKKTRFLTSTGIKEAGRESLGAVKKALPTVRKDDDHDVDDDDDDLDII